MKRFLLFAVFLIILILLGIFFVRAAKEKVRQDFARPIPYPTSSPTPPPRSSDSLGQIVVQESNSLFVPYWSLKDFMANSGKPGQVYDEYIYFGIAPGKDGIDLKEQGALNLDSFVVFVPKDKKKHLTVRMIDPDTNFAILKDSAKQKMIINQAISLAKDKKFDGIVLDLEVTAIPFESLVKQITEFTNLFYKETKRKDLEFAITMYGDVFYRLRPFDVKALANNTDRVIIMAYDFSKAKGNPGPNFPLRGEDRFGYSLEKMIEDFSKAVPAEKITVAFGLFGYDWLVDSRDRTLTQAKSVSSAEVQKKFIDNCVFKSCSFSRDSEAKEIEIHYRDLNGQYHIIWFEDMDSVAAKKEFLKSRGLGSFSYWAYSYF